MRNVSGPLLVTFAIAISGCQSEAPTASAIDGEALQRAQQPALALSNSTNYRGHRAVLGIAETITDPGSGEAGRVVWLQKDLGNAQLAHDFVYGDPRRAEFNGGFGGVTYGVNDGFLSSDAQLENQVDWLHDSISVWDGEQCGSLTLSENEITSGRDGSVATYFKSKGRRLPLPEADLTQVGFLGKGAMFPAGSNVLGVTYTLFWEDENGQLTDIDRNGKIDVAFREIYYNDQYEWSDNGVEGPQPNGVRYFDFPSVAIHEVGHGFSTAHFGSIGVQDGFLVASPRAVMNAIYGGTMRALTGRDEGAHCSNWAQWPIN